jgi:hypothetical protein
MAERVPTATGTSVDSSIIGDDTPLRERLAWYAFAALITCGTIFGGMRLDEVSLRAPLTYGGGTPAGKGDYGYAVYGSAAQLPDVLLIMPMVKATLERGSHWRNERMGYPGILELHDFPVIDHLHFAIIRLLGQIDWYAFPAFALLLAAPWLVRITGRREAGIGAAIALAFGTYFAIHALLGEHARIWNYVEVYNAYYLLTYPLTTLTAMYAYRRLGLSLPMSCAGGLLYSVLPYHYLRGESHYFLSAYWMVPLSWLPALEMCRGSLPFFRKEPGGTQHFEPFRFAGWKQILLAAFTASAGAYYAFFACLIYGFTGAYRSLATRSVRPLISGVLLAGWVGVFGIVNHLPAIAYARENGKNAVTTRLADEAEFYGLKFAHLVLPVDGHNYIGLSRAKSKYNSPERPLQTENTCATLGAVGTAGLFVLLVALADPRRREWPYGPIAVIAAALFLYGTVGGFSAVFNLFVFDQVRCPNRISIYMAFICLFAALRPLDRFLASRTGRMKRFRIPAIAGLAFLGVVDQTPSAWFSDHIVQITHANAVRFHADRDFFTRIEERMNPGAKIFCMPYMRFPEEPPLNEMNTYEHARGYLHTNTLVWSYGAMKQREADAWHENVYHGARDQIIRRLVVRGFDGIFLDKRGYVVDKAHHAEQMFADLKAGAESNGRVKLPVIQHPDGDQVFLDIRPYRDWLEAQDPVQFAAWAAEERGWVSLTWLRGSHSPEGYGLQHLHRWMYDSTTAMIVNPSDRVRTFRFSATFGTDFGGRFDITLDGGAILRVGPDGEETPWRDAFPIEHKDNDTEQPRKKLGELKEYVLKIPPGRHELKFRCHTPPFFLPFDSRPICYSLVDLKFHETR